MNRAAATAIVLSVVLSALDLSAVALALPAITRDLGLAASEGIWIVNASGIACAAFLLPAAILGERVGYRRIYLAGAALVTLASAAAAASTSLPPLLMARVAQGVGFAGMLSVNSALLRITWPAERLGQGIALNSMAIAATSVAAPLLTGVALAQGAWQWVFIAVIPVAVLLLASGWQGLPHNPVRSAPTQLTVGAVLLNAGMFVLLFAGADFLRASVRAPEGSGGRFVQGICLLGLSGALAWVYLRRQARLERPLFPVDLLGIPVFRLSMITSLCAFAAQMIAMVGLPFLLLADRGLQAWQAGLILACWPLAVIPSAYAAARLSRRVPDGLVSAAGLVHLALSLMLLALLPPTAAAWAVMGCLVLCGVGFGLFQSPNNHVIVTSAPLARAGAAGGMLGTARLVGQSAGALLLAFVFEVAGGAMGPAVNLALGLAAGLAALAAAVSAARTSPGVRKGGR